ncbi:NAD(P)-dependent oxidoreductase [Metabacillus litoralis]|uniref:NAD(P)-dependent oxidoreductase n=1 Tax=Metabacillus litoralis TaxID=152268 RepID=UPI000EF5BF5F|nr:NAD(P)-dependent oxidoreductase [Metabacillus litoralis]MCM3160062.1 NAD(P)-dependent oxidoreductase [Metabacillus litoralis]MCM3408646.1 NAD(P)-dependent oxidoreductase [Metabacillus litoralis]UHA59693.1 NAD(P)-dependent oxidoreductase [Metabacillus litoralis]
MSIKRIGFIGLGAMGLPMAKNLLSKEFELHVIAHRNRQPVEELRALGATEHSSLSDIFALCDCIISILPTDKEMESVLLNEQALEVINPGSVLIEMTSGSPEMMKKVHATFRKKGIPVLDGPVSGGTVGAENGTLTVMAGGDKEVLEKTRPVLDAIAKNIYLVGSVGAGKAIKAINQMLAAVHMVASAEAVALAEKLEINMDSLKEVVGNSSGASWMLANKMDSLVNRDFTPGFKLNLMKKDVKIAVKEGQDKQLPLANYVLELFEQASTELGEKDFSAVGKSSLSS